MNNTVELNQRNFTAQLNKAKADIAHTTDGPVDQFVMIARAIELARNNEYKPVGVDCPIANALFELLQVC